MMTKKNRSGRRDFLKTTGLASVGLAIGLDSSAGIFTVTSIPYESSDIEINTFILIRSSGEITLINPRNDMGQGTIYSVPALIAEELEVDLAQVTVIQSDGKSKYGSQTAGGSTSIRQMWLPLRKAGAATKEMLVRAAANRWKIPEDQCYAANGRVHRKGSNDNLSYGQLAEDAAKLKVPENPVLKDPKNFNIIGKNRKRLDMPARVTGKAVFGIDIEVPGMLYASIQHSPMIFGKIVSIDDAAMRNISGVLHVMRCERKMIYRDTESVAVIATSWWAAEKGRRALKVEWDNGGLEKTLHTEEYFGRCYEAARTAGVVYEEAGNFSQKFETSPLKLDVTYETPFLSHVPVEPENATAHVKEDGTVEIWAPIQGPGETLNEVAEYLGIPSERIKIYPALMGGSYGRKAYVDFVKEACFLSNKLKKPVKVIWTREDHIKQGPYRPGMLSHMQGFVADGRITGYHHHAIGESILGQVFKGLEDGKPDEGLCSELSSKASRYQFTGAEKISWTNVKTEIPIMWWRSVNVSNFAWGQECFIDELAHLAGKDPLQARLDILKDDRFRNVLEVLAEKSNYHQQLPAGRGRGISLFHSFDSIVGCCIIVTKNGKGITIDHVVAVIDCGMYVDADTVKAQTEGNIVMGLSAAIKKGITFRNGVCQQNNYTNYHVMRINEMPRIDIHIVENKETPGGVGEAGLPPVAPALGNAIFLAAGLRIRNLPLDIHDLGA